jgi:hypothetical protein
MSGARLAGLFSRGAALDLKTIADLIAHAGSYSAGSIVLCVFC